MSNRIKTLIGLAVVSNLLMYIGFSIENGWAETTVDMLKTYGVLGSTIAIVWVVFMVVCEFVHEIEKSEEQEAKRWNYPPPDMDFPDPTSPPVTPPRRN